MSELYLNWNPILDGTIFTRQLRPPIQTMLPQQTLTCHQLVIVKCEIRLFMAWNTIIIIVHLEMVFDMFSNSHLLTRKKTWEGLWKCPLGIQWERKTQL